MATRKRKVNAKSESLDAMVEANEAHGTDFQAYLRACFQEGKVL